MSIGRGWRSSSRVVITIAGLLALTRIPVAQFPDIVPPQVQVTANFPGASAAVVESSIAQPIEAQVIGVDKMIYMKSTSANDGSYTLTVSFVLGSDPDIDTVNVNNRVQTALAQLPAEVQLEGLTVQKKSSAILQFICFTARTASRTRCSSPITRSSMCSTYCRALRVSARPRCSARSTTRCASGSIPSASTICS